MLQVSTASRNARLDSLETTLGSSPILRVRTGAPPSGCASADTGSVLASLTLPADAFANAANGSKTLQGTWSGSASGAGTAGHFRLYDSGGTTCHQQGAVTATGGGGDMTVDNVTFAVGQGFSVTTYTITDPNG